MLISTTHKVTRLCKDVTLGLKHATMFGNEYFSGLEQPSHTAYFKAYRKAFANRINGLSEDQVAAIYAQADKLSKRANCTCDCGCRNCNS